MQTIMINGNDYGTAAELHKALKTLLALPDYYGMNADALNDCLSERTEPAGLWIASPGSGETAEALKTVARVFADNGGAVKEI